MKLALFSENIIKRRRIVDYDKRRFSVRRISARWRISVRWRIFVRRRFVFVIDFIIDIADFFLIVCVNFLAFSAYYFRFFQQRNHFLFVFESHSIFELIRFALNKSHRFVLIVKNQTCYHDNYSNSKHFQN